MRREGSSVAKVFLYLNFLTGGNHLEKSFHRCVPLCLESVCLLHWCQSIMNEWKNAFNVKITIIEERLPKPLLCSTDTFHWREIWQENQHFASMTTVYENYLKSLIHSHYLNFVPKNMASLSTFEYQIVFLVNFGSKIQIPYLLEL